MKRIVSLLIITLYLSSSLAAQEDKGEQPWSVNEATLVGAGGYNIKDSYLSPLKYTGWGTENS